MSISQQKTIFAAHFAIRFAAANWVSLCCEVAHVCQNRFRNCEIPCGMEPWLRNQGFSRFIASQPFRSCELGAPVLRSGTRVPYLVSQQRKFSQRSQISCGMVWQQSANFAEDFLRLRSLVEPCFCSVFALFLLRFLPFNLFAISSTYDHSKRLKHT